MNGKAFYKKPWYGSYSSMLNRCENPKAHNYRIYGGRGIKVCSEWHDIENFEKWVNQSGYKNGLTLDRINTDGDYSPDNCRWATKKQQANNRRNTVQITINGITKTISEWAEFSGLSRSTINGRYRDGISGEMLLMKPQDTRFKKGYNRYGKNRKHYADYPSNKAPILAKRYEANGEYLTITELSQKYGVKRSVLENRIRRGVKLEQALKTDVIEAERKEDSMPSQGRSLPCWTDGPDGFEELTYHGMAECLRHCANGNDADCRYDCQYVERDTGACLHEYLMSDAADYLDKAAAIIEKMKKSNIAIAAERKDDEQIH